MDRPELAGSLITMEFGPGGRIFQLWVADPATPDDGEEFQFVAPPLNMGEEIAEDYYPGTILLGARTHPEEPWIVSRNTGAEPIGESDDPRLVAFRYEFSFLDELEATGRFYEMNGRLPQVVWELTIRNRSRRSVEIGELGFPLALNNVLDGFPRSDHGAKEMFADRLHVHKFIGSSGSYVLAQRLNGAPPGLLIYPGGDTRWEFYNHVPASLNTDYQWEGVPVVYVHSRAAIEREEWGEWFYGHSSTVLEPDETRRYETRFVALDRRPEARHQILSSVGRPTIRLYPGAVAPADVGITLEVAGTTPARFWTDVDVRVETESDDEGGICEVLPRHPGSVRIGFEDTAGRDSETQLLFTPPIATLIRARAAWILQRQVVETGPLAGAIAPADVDSEELKSDLRHYALPFGIRSSLSDALFLAEKNVGEPDPEQMRALDRYLEAFLEAKVRNPADGSIGCVLTSDYGVAACYGFADMYPLTALLYGSMADLAEVTGATARPPREYLERALETLSAMWEHAFADPVVDHPIGLMSHLPGLLERARRHGLGDEADALDALLTERWERIASRTYPFAAGAYWSPDAFEESLAAARFTHNLELKERLIECLVANRSLAPCWWWYCSDKRWGAISDGNDAAVDNGELAQGRSTVANSAVLISLFSRDYADLPEWLARMAFGGLLGVWSLVREDGAAAMGFCPDAASGHFGYASTTGDIGCALYQYMKATGSYVLPSLNRGPLIFGCHFDIVREANEEHYVVRPWDGVGRKVVVRQVGLEVSVSTGRIVELRFNATKRWARVLLQNPSDKELRATIVVRGLWGKSCEVAGTRYGANRGVFEIPVTLEADATRRVEIEDVRA